MSTRKTILIVFLTLCFFYLVVLQIKAIWFFTIDDMYISLRYAKHWASGQGLLWNIGEEPVEGYSSFSFVVLAVMAIKLNIDPVIMLKAAGILGLILSVISLYYLSRFWFSKWIAVIPCLWLLLYRGEIIWSVSGLETTVYQALICASMYFLLRAMGYRLFPLDRGASNYLQWIIAGFLLALAGMTRPEAPVLMLIFYGLALLDKPKNEGKNYYKGLLLSCLSFAVLYLPFFLWRWQYYGQLFPNAVYCKGFRGFSYELDIEYLRLIWPFVVFAIPAFFKGNDKRYYFLWLPSVIYLLLLIGAEPIVAFSNRLFLPVFILLLPLTLQGILCLNSYLLPKKTLSYYICVIVSVVLFALLFIPKFTLANYRYFTINPQMGLQLRQQVVNWLEQHAPAGSQVVLADSGMIPYKSALNFIDSYCLNNKRMTRLSTRDMYLWQCHDVVATKPEIVILTSLIENGQTIYTPTDICLSDEVKKNNSYKIRTVVGAGNQNSFYRYEIYTRSN